MKEANIISSRQDNAKGENEITLFDGELPYSSLSNFLLLPLNYDVKVQDPNVQKILRASTVFRRLYDLEKSIQPILSTIESRGLVVSNRWFLEGLVGHQDRLARSSEKICDHFLVENNVVDKQVASNFFKNNKLPEAYSREGFRQYQYLHPIYKLLLSHDKHNQFLNQWGERLVEKGTTVKGGVLLQGQWSSFASYSGRIFAKQLPLTSLPRQMRDYIQESGEITSLDFNNGELRFVAYYSRCQKLLQQFQSGEDIHYLTGKMIVDGIGFNEAEITVIRDMGKEFTFSLLYGASLTSMTNSLRKIVPTVTSVTVSNLIHSFYSNYPEVLQFLETLEVETHLLTPFGRVKPLATFKPTQKRNFPLQSSVSVAVKQLMVIASKYAEVIHVVHDEIWIHTPSKDSIVIDEIIEAFYRQLHIILPGFPSHQFIKKEKIGGK